jgi:hypothetical protein
MWMVMVGWKFLQRAHASKPYRMQHDRHATPTSLGSYVASVAFGSSRALSSYARRLFESRYRPRHRFPAIVFAFDALLVGTIVALLILIGSLLTGPVLSPGINISFVSPTIVTAAPLPLTAHLRVTDLERHNDVRLQWHLPPGTEILQSQPHMSVDGTVRFGDLAPGTEVTSNVVVRLFQPVGYPASFGFRVQERRHGSVDAFVGAEERTVTSSGLDASVPEPFRVDAVAPRGVVIPLRIQNHTDQPMPFVQLTLTERPRSFPGDVTLGTVAPHESRFVFVPLGDLTRPPALQWTLRSSGREIAQGSWRANIVSLDMPRITVTSNGRAGVTVDRPFVNGSLAIVHPLLDQAVQEHPIAEASSLSFTLPPTRRAVSSAHEWMAAVIGRGVGDTRVLGPASMGVASITLPLTVEVRYTGHTGDQLGVGPLPPRVGRETRYTVFWRIGPIDNAVRNLTVRTTLSPRVRATGAVSAVDGGTWSVNDRTVTWTLPLLGSDASLHEAMFAFEVGVTPDGSDVGSPMTLIGTTNAEAQDIETSRTFTASLDPQTTDLPADPAAQGKGSVVAE